MNLCNILENKKRIIFKDKQSILKRNENLNNKIPFKKKSTKNFAYLCKTMKI